MSYGLKRIWREGDTWRKLAYIYYRDSEQYRYLLALNPSFDIRVVPAPGTEINVSGPVGGKIASTGLTPATPGLLEQVDIAPNLATISSPTQQTPTSTEQSIFPWNSYVGYVDRLGEYTAAALLNKSRINGYQVDSPEALTVPLGTFPELSDRQVTTVRSANQ